MVSDILTKRWKKLNEFAPVSHLSEQERHCLRIQAKTLRYACEFVGNAFPGAAHTEQCEHLSAHLGSLQDYLGKLNDVVSLRERLHTMNGDITPSAIIKGKASRRHLLKAAEIAQELVLRQKPFWQSF
ncbi:CHAD domain-containing protein [Methylovirgula sp. 4M-Z18]|nr:CHAD domain-containing protein [Methylovirgula sp. 4M-Z18]